MNLLKEVKVLYDKKEEEGQNCFQGYIKGFFHSFKVRLTFKSNNEY